MPDLFALVFDNQNELARFVKFAIVGAIGAVVDFGVLNLLVQVFGWNDFFANIVSVTCAIISNFTWNRLWTFPESRARPLSTQFGQFALVNLLGLGINQAVFWATGTWMFKPLFGFTLGYNLAKATAIVVVLFWNFTVNRRTTYRGI